MPNDGASIGSVYVDVLPKSDSFWSTWVAQNRPGASKAGDDLGAPIGRAISDAISKGIRDGLRTSPRSESARAGEESGGAFADSFKRRVEAALKSLPKAQIGAATNEAEQKIRDLRNDLDTLSSKKVGVDINAADARVELTHIHEELDRLNTASPNVQVRADAGRAATELAAFNAEVDRLDGRNVSVTADDSEVKKVGNSAREASSGVSLLVATGVALGPAIVPGAAAGAAAIAGILPMALGAAGGIGVLVLAVSGVVGAVKAMSAADDQAAQSSKSLASNQLQMAGAADAVRSAQAGLANTVASAADSQRRASEAISNAELSETDAHRQLLTAQQAVTQARIDAARAAEDLTSRIAHNSLDQQQATLDVAKAEDQLKVARQNAAAANTPSNNRAVAEAQIALEQQQLRVKDLQTEHKRLAEDKTKSDAAGIDGSTQVVAALERVRAATEQVHKAEQATADARAAYATQARQSEFAVAQAKQAVINAERQVQAATVSSATAGGAAIQKLQQQMADLSPEGQRFAAFIYSLRNPLLDLRRTAESGLLPGVQDAIQIVLTQMPRANDYVRRFSTELGGLAVSGARAFTSPYWTTWADLMVSKAIPAMDTGARISYNFALGIAGLVKAALPLGEGFGSGLLNFSQRFATYANQLEHTEGYRAFLDYVRTEGPIVAHTIGDVVQAALRLVEAIAPLGGTSLTIIRLVADAINALPIPVLTTLAAVIGGVVLATKAWRDVITPVRDLLKGDLFAAIQLFGGEVAGGFRTGLKNAGDEAGNFSRALSGIKGGAKGAIDGIGGLAGMIGPGGALAIGVGVAVIGLGILAQKMAEQKAKADAAVAAYERFGDAVAKARAAGKDSDIPDLIKNDKQIQDLILHSSQYGVAAKDVVDALSGQRSAFSNVNAALAAHRAELVKTIQEHTIQGGKGQRVMDDTAQAASNEVKHLDDLAGRFGQVATDQANAAGAAALYNRAQSVVTTTVYQQTPAQAALGDALKKISDATSSAAEKADALRLADEQVFGAARAAIRSQEDQAAAEDALAQAGKRNADAHIYGAQTLDLHTEAGRNNRRILEDRLLALGQEYLADVQSGVAIDAATKKHDTNRDAIQQAALAAGFDKDEVGKLVTTFGTLPTDPKVQVTVSGVDQALTQLQNLEIAQLALKQGLDPAEATRQWKAQHAQAQSLQHGLATGGPVYGPGGPTDDAVPAVGPGGIYRLSNGEWVQQAAAVDYYGHGIMAALNQRLIPREWFGGAFATGGLVRPPTQPSSAAIWPYPTTAEITRIPSMSEVRNAAVPSAPAYNGSAGVGQWTNVVLSVLAALGQSSGLLGAVLRRIAFESGGNPTIVNTTDSNWYAGHPSVGLAQVIAGTYRAYVGQYDRGPYSYGVSVDPFANVYAGMNYAIHRYGSVSRIDPLVMPTGYDSGGDLPPGLSIAYNGTGKPEAVFTEGQLAELKASGGTTITVPVYGSDGQSVYELAKAVAAELAWQMK